MIRRNNNFRLAIGLSALLGLGLLLTDATPASADHKYLKKNSHRGQGRDRGKRWHTDKGRHLGNRDFDRDGIVDRRDWDIDGDGIANRYDRHDYSAQRVQSRSIRRSRYPREYDWDQDGVRNKYDRYDHDPRRR